MNAFDGLDDIHNIQKCQLPRILCEHKTAVEPALRIDQSAADESLHEFGEIGRRNLRDF